MEATLEMIMLVAYNTDEPLRSSSGGQAASLHSREDTREGA